MRGLRSIEALQEGLLDESWGVAAREAKGVLKDRLGPVAEVFQHLAHAALVVVAHDDEAAPGAAGFAVREREEDFNHPK